MNPMDAAWAVLKAHPFMQARGYTVDSDDAPLGTVDPAVLSMAMAQDQAEREKRERYESDLSPRVHAYANMRHMMDGTEVPFNPINMESYRTSSDGFAPSGAETRGRITRMPRPDTTIADFYNETPLFTPQSALDFYNEMSDIPYNPEDEDHMRRIVEAAQQGPSFYQGITGVPPSIPGGMPVNRTVPEIDTTNLGQGVQVP